MTHNLITITNGVTRHPDYRLAEPLNLTIEAGKSYAICGQNGAGKSLLVDILTGAHPLLGDAIHYDFGGLHNNRTSDNIRLITFRDVYGGNEPAYYQQRWNQADEQIFPTVAEVLQQASSTTEGLSSELRRELGIESLLSKPINQLSSGELRRMQLAKQLSTTPQLLIIDNPYIGLDVEARAMLTHVLERLSQSLTLIFVVSRSEDIPPFIQKAIIVEDKRVSSPLPASAFAHFEYGKEQESKQEDWLFLPPVVENFEASQSNRVVDFRHITIAYGRRTILKDLNWEVKRGEHWALTGENGAGKSTLLSLVCADNPQAYACDIRLFGYKRGGGESIWDIKKHIGYVSPEIYSTYRKPLSALQIVASGLRDTIGLYGKATQADIDRSKLWLSAFHALHLAERNYLQLSSGEQRLVLLVRAFVKNPDLLILDEPFHGLDNTTRHHAQRVIDLYMRNPRKTLIMVTHYNDELPSCIDHHLKLVKH